jgi:hypothetical protein
MEYGYMVFRATFRAAILSTALVLYSAMHASARPAEPIFSTAERESIVKWWQSENRYRVELAEVDGQKGPFAARLTPDASTWLLAYTKAVSGSVKIAPTQTAKASNSGDTKGWEDWLSARVKHDWQTARAEAHRRNTALLTAPSEAFSADDTSLSPTPTSEPSRKVRKPSRAQDAPISIPPHPGPAPQSLIDTLGAPPVIASVVAPNRHVIHFDIENRTIEMLDNVRLPERYAYYRFPRGVNSVGAPTSTIVDETVRAKELFAEAGLSDTARKAFTAISRLEGTFEASQTYDTGYVSIGFIQFTTGPDGDGSLIRALVDEKTASPDAFVEDFHRYGIDVTIDGKITVIDPKSGAELVGTDAVKCIVDDPRLVGVFVHAGRYSIKWMAAQVRAAYKVYWPMDGEITLQLGGNPTSCKVSDIVQSEAGITTLLDRKINRGNIREFPDVVNRIAKSHGCASLDEIRQYEKEIVAAMRYRVDFLKSSDLGQPAEPPADNKDPRVSRSQDSGRGSRSTGSLPSRAAKPRSKRAN